MPWVIQIGGFILAAIGIAFALWVSVWVLLFLFGVMMLSIGWMHLREFLTRKGILNEKFGEPTDAGQVMHEQITVIDTEFSRVEEDKQK